MAAVPEIYPKDKSLDGIVLEYKKVKEGDGLRLQCMARDAVGQIVHNSYYADLETRGIQRGKIRVYGIAFSGKRVIIDGGYLPEVFGWFSEKDDAVDLQAAGCQVFSVSGKGGVNR